MRRRPPGSLPRPCVWLRLAGCGRRIGRAGGLVRRRHVGGVGEAQREAVVLGVEQEQPRLDQLHAGGHDAQPAQGEPADLSGGQRGRRNEVAVGLGEADVLEAELEAAALGQGQQSVVDVGGEAIELARDAALDRVRQRLQRDRAEHEPRVAGCGEQRHHQEHRRRDRRRARPTAATCAPAAAPAVAGRLHGGPAVARRAGARAERPLVSCLPPRPPRPTCPGFRKHRAAASAPLTAADARRPAPAGRRDRMCSRPELVRDSTARDPSRNVRCGRGKSDERKAFADARGGRRRPRLHAPRRGRRHHRTRRLARPRRSALLLSQGRHGRMHRRGRRLFTAARPLCARRYRRRRPLARYGRQPRQVPRHRLSISLAADVDKAAAEAYGVWVEKSMYGRRFMGVERTTVLIGAQGRIARTWRK